MKTYCKNGHLLDEGNLYVGKGHRCLTCKREQAIASYRRKRARDIAQGLVAVVGSCKHCGVAIPAGTNRRYCSDRCGRAAFRARHRERRNESKREARRLRAERQGRQFVSLGPQVEIEAQAQAKREQQARRQQAKRQARLERRTAEEAARQTRFAEEAARRERVTAGSFLVCQRCGSTKARQDFSPSYLLAGQEVCRVCFRLAANADFQRQKNALTSNYVKKQIAKRARLKMRDIPHVLVEVKRVQLQITRLLRKERTT